MIWVSPKVKSFPDSPHDKMLHMFMTLFFSSYVHASIVNDNDIGTSGSIDSWKLILTYQDI